MPLDTNVAFTQETRKRATQPIFLYTIYDYDSNGTNKYFAAYDINVTFDSIEYIRFPITHDVISENTRGEIDSTKIQLSNISRLIEYYLQNYDLRGKKISIKMVFANLLNDPDACVEFSNYIDSYTSNVKDVVFSIMSKFDIANLSLPGRTYIKSHCQWLFASPAIRALGKGSECGYTGSETICNRTRGRCRELGNQVRFGAFPSAVGGNSYA
jgi:lambda family phage minor tail protein L